MWIFSKDSFLSIVEDRNDSSKLLVRARIKGDIEKVFPHARVISLKQADYRYRTSLDRLEVARALVEQVEAIHYDNFKGEVLRASGADRHAAYFDVWEKLGDWQDQHASKRS